MIKIVPPIFRRHENRVSHVYIKKVIDPDGVVRFIYGPETRIQTGWLGQFINIVATIILCIFSATAQADGINPAFYTATVSVIVVNAVANIGEDKDGNAFVFDGENNTEIIPQVVCDDQGTECTYLAVF
ncbi:MAG: hypothetical protein HY052_04330 [Proteobacteria bacterium]|nr:hypothetical protein [Pseudomonadota bacterium]